MMDMFPFPRTTGNTTEDKVADILSYLIQFKEALEFALMNISTENLSPDLVNKLNEMGANIEKSSEERVNEIRQISVNTLTISDVCESELLKTKILDEIEKNVTINVNVETGHLEYTTRKEGV